MNQEIDDEIMSLKDLGIEFPDSYSQYPRAFDKFKIVFSYFSFI